MSLPVTQISLATFFYTTVPKGYISWLIIIYSTWQVFVNSIFKHIVVNVID